MLDYSTGLNIFHRASAARFVKGTVLHPSYRVLMEIMQEYLMFMIALRCLQWQISSFSITAAEAAQQDAWYIITETT